MNVKALALCALLFAPLASAERNPLPDNDEWHFFAHVRCGNLEGVVYITPETSYIIPAGKMVSQQVMAQVMSARAKAMESGNAYVIQMANEGQCKDA